jgi:hypothetical protein
MAMKKTKLLELLDQFPALPDEAVTSADVTAAILGVCTRTVRYHPHLEKVRVSEHRDGIRVGSIRRLIRDGIPKLAANASFVEGAA